MKNSEVMANFDLNDYEGECMSPGTPVDSFEDIEYDFDDLIITPNFTK